MDLEYTELVHLVSSGVYGVGASMRVDLEYTANTLKWYSPPNSTIPSYAMLASLLTGNMPELTPGWCRDEMPSWHYF